VTSENKSWSLDRIEYFVEIGLEVWSSLYYMLPSFFHQANWYIVDGIDGVKNHAIPFSEE